MNTKQLTAYQLSCGYVQKTILKSCHLFETTLELYKEHGHYHVRSFRLVNNSSSAERLTWEVFDSLKDARNFFNYFKKTVEKIGV